MTVKFEELVGPRGGGTEEAQQEAIERVVWHLDIERNADELRSIGRRLFGAGRTFRKGQAGGWRGEFSEEHKRATKKVAGDLLVELGYERDASW